MKKIKAGFDKVVEWDKALIKKCQDKFGWTDYQVTCIASYALIAYSHIS